MSVTGQRTAETCAYPQLRLALAGDQRAIEALARLEAGLTPVRAVVERYGNVWLKDTDYYAAVRALGIEECSCGGIDAVPHATDHTPDCSYWNTSTAESPDRSEE